MKKSSICPVNMSSITPASSNGCKKKRYAQCASKKSSLRLAESASEKLNLLSRKTKESQPKSNMRINEFDLQPYYIDIIFNTRGSLGFGTSSLFLCFFLHLLFTFALLFLLFLRITPGSEYRTTHSHARRPIFDLRSKHFLQLFKNLQTCPCSIKILFLLTLSIF